MTQPPKDTTLIGTDAPITSSRRTPAPHAASPPPEAIATQGTTIGMRPRSTPAPASTGSDPDIFVGQELCGYTIRRKLAEGGMGVVYEAEHAKIRRIAAIKVLRLEFCRAEDMVERFYQEARAVNAIQHENIVDV